MRWTTLNIRYANIGLNIIRPWFLKNTSHKVLWYYLEHPAGVGKPAALWFVETATDGTVWEPLYIILKQDFWCSKQHTRTYYMSEAIPASFPSPAARSCLIHFTFVFNRFYMFLCIAWSPWSPWLHLLILCYLCFQCWDPLVDAHGRGMTWMIWCCIVCVDCVSAFTCEFAAVNAMGLDQGSRPTVASASCAHSTSCGTAKAVATHDITLDFRQLSQYWVNTVISCSFLGR